MSDSIGTADTEVESHIRNTTNLPHSLANIVAGYAIPNCGNLLTQKSNGLISSPDCGITWNKLPMDLSNCNIIAYAQNINGTIFVLVRDSRERSTQDNKFGKFYALIFDNEGKLIKRISIPNWDDYTASLKVTQDGKFILSGVYGTQKNIIYILDINANRYKLIEKVDYTFTLSFGTIVNDELKTNAVNNTVTLEQDPKDEDFANPSLLRDIGVDQVGNVYILFGSLGHDFLILDHNLKSLSRIKLPYCNNNGGRCHFNHIAINKKHNVVILGSLFHQYFLATAESTQGWKTHPIVMQFSYSKNFRVTDHTELQINFNNDMFMAAIEDKNGVTLMYSQNGKSWKETKDMIPNALTLRNIIWRRGNGKFVLGRVNSDYEDAKYVPSGPFDLLGMVRDNDGDSKNLQYIYSDTGENWFDAKNGPVAFKKSSSEEKN